MRILLVEDDDMLGNAVRDHLAAHGHAVDWMTRLDASSEARATTAYDLVLLDLNFARWQRAELSCGRCGRAATACQ